MIVKRICTRFICLRLIIYNNFFISKLSYLTIRSYSSVNEIPKFSPFILSLTIILFASKPILHLYIGFTRTEVISYVLLYTIFSVLLIYYKACKYLPFIIKLLVSKNEVVSGRLELFEDLKNFCIVP